MKLPSKEDVRVGIQVLLLINATVWGFFWQYIYLWAKLDLPQEWWTLLVCCVLALSSTWGLIHWIARD
jgi:hypothetical protein